MVSSLPDKWAMEHKSEIALNQTLLYKLLYEFSFSRTKSESKAKFFAETMEGIFKFNEHQMVTVTKNFNDGIGDYTSQVYFIEKLTNLMAEFKNIRLKNISFVSKEKQPIAKIVRESKINEESVYVMGNGNSEQDYSQKTSFIGVPDETEETLLSDFINNASMLFNIAIGLNLENNQLVIQDRGGGFVSNRELNVVLDYKIPAKSNAFVSSWTQYSFYSKEKSWLNDNYANLYIDSSYNGPIFSERSMGIHDNQMGIRFDNQILGEIKKSENKLLSSLSPDFSNRVFPGITNPQDQSYAIGYLQSKSASQAFVLLATQTSPKSRDMNILVNIDYFDLNNTEMVLFREKLKEMGITSIELIDKNKEIKTIELSENPENPRKLRLINFKGISDSDKAIWYGLAEMVGASGDNSISEMMTAGLKDYQTSLPFPQQFITSNSSCIRSILEEVKGFQDETGTSHQELCNYLNHLCSATTSDGAKEVSFKYDHQYGEVIKNNRVKITQSWHQFCQFCLINRNEETHFNELLVSYLFHHLLIQPKFDVDQFKKLTEALGVNAFQNETLLHLAVKANNTSAAALILDNNLCDINQPHSFNGYTALHLAVSQKNKDMVELLIQKNVNWNAVDQCNKTALILAIEKGDSDSFKFLMNKDIEHFNSQGNCQYFAFNLYKDQSDEPITRQDYLQQCLYFALESGNQKIVQTLMDAGVDINKGTKRIPLVQAVDRNDENLVQFLLKNGAKANGNGDSSPIKSALDKPNILKLLLAYQPKLDLRTDEKGFTLLSLACLKDPVNVEAIELLLEHGANVVINDTYKMMGEHFTTPLHTAARSGNAELVKLLLKYGADATLKDGYNRTPLEVYLDKYDEFEKSKHVPFCVNFRQRKVAIEDAFNQNKGIDLQTAPEGSIENENLNGDGIGDVSNKNTEINLQTELEGYIEGRKKEAEVQKSQYNTFFGKVTGMSSCLKIGAAQKIVKAIKDPTNENITFTHNELLALGSGRLGGLIEKHKDKLPEQYVKAENEYSKNLNKRM
jgi:ankyrin repeat protein